MRAIDPPVYVAIALVVTAFGILAIFSIGAPFLLTGVLMLALFRVRRRTDVLVSVLAWPWVFALVFILVGPLGCTSTAVRGLDGMVLRRGITACTNVLGIDYSGRNPYSPPLLPAFLAAFAVASAAALLVHVALRRRRSARSAPAE